MTFTGEEGRGSVTFMLVLIAEHHTAVPALSQTETEKLVFF